MHKSAIKCNETVGKWCKNKHRASKIIDTLETYHPAARPWERSPTSPDSLQTGGAPPGLPLPRARTAPSLPSPTSRQTGDAPPLPPVGPAAPRPCSRRLALQMHVRPDAGGGRPAGGRQEASGMHFSFFIKSCFLNFII
jgi:hypothetical protein